MNATATIAALLGSTLLATAPSADPLPLADAVRMARESSPVALESEARTEAARQEARAARRDRLPGIEIREIIARTDSPADAFGLELMQERFSFQEFTRRDPNDPEPMTDYATELEASMPLFTGGKLTAGIGQAERMERAARAAGGHTRVAVDLAVVQAYLDVLLADRFADLAEKALDTTRRHVAQAEDFFTAGMIVESDLLQARVQLARMEENRITARNQARLARAGLSRTIGIDQGRLFDLVEPEGHPSDEQIDLPEAIERGLTHRGDLRAVEARVDAARLGIRMARGDYFPEIVAAGKVAWHDDKPFGPGGRSYTLLGMARWNLWNWGQTGARVARSRSEHVAAGEELRAYRHRVEFEIRQAWQALDEATARHRVASEALGSAERALAILDDRFSEGVARTTDLLDAETLAHEARVREAQARFDVQRSLRTLWFATGSSPVPEVQ